MKTLLIIAVCIWTCSSGAANFVNLKFDEAVLNRLSLDRETGATSAPIGDMLPGWEVSLRSRFGLWQAYTGRVELSNGIGGSPIALSTFYSHGNTGYSVSMQAIPAIGFPVRPDPPDVRVSTKGIVPASAIFFEWSAGSGLEVIVSNESRQVTALGSAGILNVSQFAGTEATVCFELRSGGSGGFDVIGFTQTATEVDLSPPSKLTHTSSGQDSVTLAWARSTDPVLGYEVFSAPNLETPFTNLISGKLITETVYTYTGADATGRFYQVRAVGVSSKSGEAVTKYSVGATIKVP